jgi:hypothetical protein
MRNIHTKKTSGHVYDSILKKTEALAYEDEMTPELPIKYNLGTFCLSFYFHFTLWVSTIIRKTKAGSRFWSAMNQLRQNSLYEKLSVPEATKSTNKTEVERKKFSTWIVGDIVRKVGEEVRLLASQIHQDATVHHRHREAAQLLSVQDLPEMKQI